MSRDPISPTVRRFILDAIDSVTELEALLLLRETPDRLWTAVAAGARLYVSPTVAAYTLSALARRELIAESPEGYRYHPPSAQVAEVVNELAATYAAQLISVTHLIHGKPSQSMQDFARAFRLRKDP